MRISYRLKLDDVDEEIIKKRVKRISRVGIDNQKTRRIDRIILPKSRVKRQRD